MLSNSSQQPADVVYEHVETDPYTLLSELSPAEVQALMSNSHIQIEGAQKVSDYFQKKDIRLQGMEVEYTENEKVIVEKVVFAWHIGPNKSTFLPGRTLEMFICNCTGSTITPGMARAARAAEVEIMLQAEKAGVVSKSPHDGANPDRVNNVQRLIVVPTDGMGTLANVTSFAKGQDIKFARKHDELMARYGIVECPRYESGNVGAVFLLPASQAKGWMKSLQERGEEAGVEIYAKWIEPDIKSYSRRKVDVSLNDIFGPDET